MQYADACREAEEDFQQEYDDAHPVQGASSMKHDEACEEFKKFKEEVEALKKLAEAASQARQAPCPRCGTCPTCGRSYFYGPCNPYNYRAL